MLLNNVNRNLVLIFTPSWLAIIDLFEWLLSSVAKPLVQLRYPKTTRYEAFLDFLLERSILLL